MSETSCYNSTSEITNTYVVEARFLENFKTIAMLHNLNFWPILKDKKALLYQVPSLYCYCSKIQICGANL